MRYTFLTYLSYVTFLIGCSPTKKSSTEISVNSLKNYSYPIFVITNNVQHTATAFFYISNDTTFLVSNYHAVKGWNPIKKNQSFSSNTLWLKYKTLTENKDTIISLNISEDVTGKIEEFSIIDRIDLIKIPITKPINGEINYINEFIDTTYFIKPIDSVFFFGHPTPGGNIQQFYSQQRIFRGSYNIKGYIEGDSAIMSNFPSLPEVERTKFLNSSRYYYFVSPMAEGGYSGSPVFGRYKKGRKITYKFAGVVFAQPPYYQQTWVIKSDVILKYLLNHH